MTTKLSVISSGDGPQILHGPTGLSAIVVMGPSGCGKSTLAKSLAKTLGWNFIEGDDHHPPANIVKMKAGKPLTDADRLPFLRSVGRQLARNSPTVASCSALSSSHRDVLRSFVDDILFVWPKTDQGELMRRMEEREGHFMPPDLLQNQLSSLEAPSSNESSLTLDGHLPTQAQVEVVLGYLSALSR
jgi:gluconokinase